MNLSVIIPTLNEAETLPLLLASLRAEGKSEILVVDGGSHDGTPDIAREWGVTYLPSTRGRAEQLNRGAAAARGDWLWFLHADTALPADWQEQLRRAMEDPAVVGGGFRSVIDASGAGYRFLDAWGWLRTRVRHNFYGDQGIFVRRAVFERLGGFAEIPACEDAELSGRMWRAGRVAILPGPIRTSARRWQRNGWWRTVAEHAASATRYGLARDQQRLPAYAPLAPTTPSVHLVVVTKAPIPGRVKTRLTPFISPSDAAQMARTFLEDTLRRVGHIPHTHLAVAVEPPEAVSLVQSLAPEAEIVPQITGDLGARMSAIVADRFARGASAVLLMGSDHPALARAEVEQAIRWLREGGDQAVIGPAEDGGYYLIGLTRPHPELFDGIPWSSSSVLQETLARAEGLSLKVRQLSLCYDVDTIEDVTRLQRETAHRPEMAPATARWLQQHRVSQCFVAEGGGVIRILFVCVQNAGRSQMAEAFARAHGAGWVEAFSAGSRPADAVHPAVVTVMQEKSFHLKGCRPKGFAQLPADPFDVVVTMGCGDACPVYPGARRIDWVIPDPKDQPIERVRQIRDEIEYRVQQVLRELSASRPADRRCKATVPRRALWILPLLLVSGWVAWGGQGRTLAMPGMSRPREIELTYLARLPKIPPDVKEVSVWIPLAKTRAEQRILRREIRSPVPYTVEKDPEYGNDILHLTLKPSSLEPVEIAIDYHALLLGPDRAVADPPPTPKELSLHLSPQGLLIIDTQVRARAAQAAAGKVTLRAKARGIYDYVIQHMVYDKTTPGYGRGDTARACQVGKGNCTDFHSLFISMARAEQIPSRFKIGFVIPPESSGRIPGYHCWAEFYADGKGWVPLDASEAWKHRERVDYYFGAHDPNRFLISTGRDIQLVPTPKNGPVNILFYPYVEMDGQPVPGVEMEFRFQDLRQKAAT